MNLNTNSNNTNTSQPPTATTTTTNTQTSNTDTLNTNVIEEEDSIVKISNKLHHLNQLNENFKKFLCKPFSYYLNDSIFKCVKVKTNDNFFYNGNFNYGKLSKNMSFYNDDNDITISDDVQSDAGSDYFIRYAPTDDEYE